MSSGSEEERKDTGEGLSSMPSLSLSSGENERGGRSELFLYCSRQSTPQLHSFSTTANASRKFLNVQNLDTRQVGRTRPKPNPQCCKSIFYLFSTSKKNPTSPLPRCPPFKEENKTSVCASVFHHPYQHILCHEGL